MIFRLNSDLLGEVLLFLSLPDLISFCLTSKSFREWIGSENKFFRTDLRSRIISFWKRKILLETELPSEGEWKGNYFLQEYVREMVKRGIILGYSNHRLGIKVNYVFTEQAYTPLINRCREILVRPFPSRELFESICNDIRKLLFHRGMHSRGLEVDIIYSSEPEVIRKVEGWISSTRDEAFERCAELGNIAEMKYLLDHKRVVSGNAEYILRYIPVRYNYLTLKLLFMRVFEDTLFRNLDSLTREVLEDMAEEFETFRENALSRKDNRTYRFLASHFGIRPLDIIHASQGNNQPLIKYLIENGSTLLLEQFHQELSKYNNEKMKRILELLDDAIENRKKLDSNFLISLDK